MTPRVRELLSWYGADNVGVLTNLSRVLNHGRLKGTGKLFIMTGDQGLVYGPAQSFAKIPDGYDPSYSIELAIESGCNAYLAPLGALEFCLRDYAGEIPVFLKIHCTHSLFTNQMPFEVVYNGINEALRLGCVGIELSLTSIIGIESKSRDETLSRLMFEAKKAGLIVTISADLGGRFTIPKSFCSVDGVSCAAHIAAQLGAHIVCVSTPNSNLELDGSKTIYAENGIKVNQLVDRVRHVVQSSFNGKRIVIFSEDELVEESQYLQEAREMARGGSFGRMLSKEAFQQSKVKTLQLFRNVMDAYIGK